jgi:hypothetical protein
MHGALKLSTAWSTIPFLLSSLHTGNANALVMFSDGTHGVFRPNSRALSTRATKPREFQWVPSDSDSDCELPPAIPSDEFSSSSATVPPRAPLPHTYAEFQQHEQTQTPPVSGARPLPTGPRPLPTTSVPADASPSSSITAHYLLVPRATWMMDGDAWTDADADAAWRTATESLFPPIAESNPPLPAWRQAQVAALNRPLLPLSPTWPPPPWGSTLLPNPPANRTPT